MKVVIRSLLDEALAPLQFQLIEAQRRIVELERRAAAPPPAATVVLAATPAPAPVAAAPVARAAPAPVAQPAPYASAIAAPARSIVAHPVSLAPAPLLDVEAINREIPIDIDMAPFDGRRRRRRMLTLFVLALLLVFGGLFAMLAQSYAPQR